MTEEHTPDNYAASLSASGGDTAHNGLPSTPTAASTAALTPTAAGSTPLPNAPNSFRDRSFSKHEIAALSPQQKQALSVMKQKILATPLGANDTATDYTHLRFLRARKFDVDAAVDMYLTQLKWRRDNHIDDVLANPPTDLRRLLSAIVPEAFHKFDRFGLPAYYMKAGKVNPTLLLKYVTVEDLIQTHLWGQEYSFQRAAEKSAELGKNIDQFVNIVDLQGLSMSHRSCLKYLKTIAALDQQYYPESLGKTYVINAPWVFPAIWKLIRAWLDPVTTEKIVVLGHNYQDVLRERFAAEDLPKEYGGQCVCSERGCIPEYTESEALKIVEESEQKLALTDVPLQAGQSHTITIQIGEWGGTVQYYFRSFKSDVGFTAHFIPSAAATGATNGRRRSSSGNSRASVKAKFQANAASITSTAPTPSSSAAATTADDVKQSLPPVQRRKSICPYPEKLWQKHERFAPGQPWKGLFVTDFPGVATLTWDNKHSWRHTEVFKFTTKYTPGIEGVKKEADWDADEDAE